MSGDKRNTFILMGPKTHKCTSGIKAQEGDMERKNLQHSMENLMYEKCFKSKTFCCISFQLSFANFLLFIATFQFPNVICKLLVNHCSLSAYNCHFQEEMNENISCTVEVNMQTRDYV